MGLYELSDGDYFLQDSYSFDEEELILRCNERNVMIVALTGSMELLSFGVVNRRFQLLHSVVLCHFFLSYDQCVVDIV